MIAANLSVIYESVKHVDDTLVHFEFLIKFVVELIIKLCVGNLLREFLIIKQIKKT